MKITISKIRRSVRPFMLDPYSESPCTPNSYQLQQLKFRIYGYRYRLYPRVELNGYPTSNVRGASSAITGHYIHP